jgi:hypothetical protein
MDKVKYHNFVIIFAETLVIILVPCKPCGELREEYKGNKQAFPTMEDFLALHEGGDAYHLFLTRILERVVGRSSWEGNCDKKLLSTFCTRSDEAFGLLLLENNYDRWTAMWRSGDLRNSKGEAPDTLYTNMAESRTRGSASNRKLEGWSQEGYARFDELYAMVKADREQPSRIELETQIRKELEAKKARKRCHKKQVLEANTGISYPCHDFDDVTTGGLQDGVSGGVASKSHDQDDSNDDNEDENSKKDYLEPSDEEEEEEEEY